MHINDSRYVNATNVYAKGKEDGSVIGSIVTGLLQSGAKDIRFTNLTKNKKYLLVFWTQQFYNSGQSIDAKSGCTVPSYSPLLQSIYPEQIAVGSQYHYLALYIQIFTATDTTAVLTLGAGSLGVMDNPKAIPIG